MAARTERQERLNDVLNSLPPDARAGKDFGIGRLTAILTMLYLDG